MKTLRVHGRQRARTIRTGSVLVEFAFIALAFYLLFAGTLELGRMITISQAIQNAARVGARELALIPLPPTATFQQALNDPQVLARIYDPAKLAFDVSSTEPDPDTWPIINRMLLPVMVRTQIGSQKFLHFPGAVLSTATGYTVGVPKIISQASDGATVIRWLPVVEEVVPDPNNPLSAPFSLASTGLERGLVALRINCPYQAVALTAYKVEGVGPAQHQEPVLATGSVSAAGGSTPPGGGTPIGTASDDGVYAGPYGLGRFYVLGDKVVRPFSRLITSQSLFRREVYR